MKPYYQVTELSTEKKGAIISKKNYCLWKLL